MVYALKQIFRTYFKADTQREGQSEHHQEHREGGQEPAAHSNAAVILVCFDFIISIYDIREHISILFADLTKHRYFPGPLGAGCEGRLAVGLGDEGGPPGVRVPRAAHTQHQT